MVRRITKLVLLVALLAALFLPSTNATGVTPLPATSLLFDSNRTGTYELYRLDANGNQSKLTDHIDDSPIGRNLESWWPKISPDRTKILFARTEVPWHDTDYKRITTWVMNVDGTNLTEILPYGRHGWVGQGHPEWSPDGTKILTMGGTNELGPQIFVVDADGSNPRQITVGGYDPITNAPIDRPGVNVDPSWSHDGNRILFVGCTLGETCIEPNYEIFSVDAQSNTFSTTPLQLTDDLVRDHDPYYSPDGSTIAWLRNSIPVLVWGIWRMDPNGGNKTAVIDDGGINSKPAWADDSDTIYFHRKPLVGFGFNVWKIQKNGAGLTEILPRPGLPLGLLGYDNEYPISGIN